MTRLRATGRYRNGGLGLDYAAGEVVEVTPELADLLMRDSPGTFEAVAAGMDAPPADKMMRRERTTRKGKTGEASDEAMSTETQTGLTRG